MVLGQIADCIPEDTEEDNTTSIKHEEILERFKAQFSYEYKIVSCRVFPFEENAIMVWYQDVAFPGATYEIVVRYNAERDYFETVPGAKYWDEMPEEEKRRCTAIYFD